MNEREKYKILDKESIMRKRSCERMDKMEIEKLKKKIDHAITMIYTETRRKHVVTKVMNIIAKQW